MAPKRVGLPNAKPEQCRKSSKLAYTAPDSGTDGAMDSQVVDTGQTVRTRASMPGTNATPRAIYCANWATEPVLE